MQVDDFLPFMERMAVDPDVARCNVGLWAIFSAFEYVPAYIEYFDFVTAIDTDDGEMPKEIVLHSAFPNPFNPETTISFNLSESMPVTLAVYDLVGQRIETLVDGVVKAGMYSAQFDGSGLSSGIYIIRLEANQQILTKKITLIK